jgi:hypothetical protein
MWVKGDMLSTVSFDRLELLRTGRDRSGKRNYVTILLEPSQLKIVYGCVLHAIGLGHLTSTGE